jgi:hypothetical protein
MTHSNTPAFNSAQTRPATLGILAILALWALMPEARRLVDWRAGFAAVSVLSVVPLLALLAPLVALIFGSGLARIDRRLLAIAWVWFGGFTSALAVALASGNETSAALYSYASFCLPAGFGLWVASLDIERSALFEIVTRFLLALATPLALYAMFQLAYPPAWDVAWMRQVRLGSIGLPLPFVFRPFSTLNAPAVFADFLVATILLNLPRLRNASALTLLQVALCGAALALSMMRSGWVALAVGIICFLGLSANRLANLTTFSLVLVFFTALTTGASSFGGGLGARLSTFTKLDSDVSYVERAHYYGEPLFEAAGTPQGAGLGVVGTAAKLGPTGSAYAFDNGYIARLTEMGWFGSACYLLVTFGALAFVLSRRTTAGSGVVAAVAAIQLALIAADVSWDSHSALCGVVFWLSLGLVSRREPEP